ncbi:MAG: hypothetical protein Q8P01_01545 [bacterium]|nr:hypothetical protein [bacterium]
MEQGKQQKHEEVSDDVRDLVIARLQVLAPGKLMSFGGEGQALTKEELISHVEKGDELGEKIIEIEMTFLRALKDGIVLDQVLAGL